MKSLNLVIVILLLPIVLILSSCSDDSMKKQEMAEENIMRLEIEPLVGPLSQRDQEFVQAVMKSVASAEEIMGELENTLQEMEAQDESHEANEMMDEAKQKILFLWNKMHNEYQPHHPQLVKLKEYYENILFRYRQGISLEMEGMELADAPKMKQGYEMTGQAIKDLQELAEQLTTAFRS